MASGCAQKTQFSGVLGTTSTTSKSCRVEVRAYAIRQDRMLFVWEPSERERVEFAKLYLVIALFHLSQSSRRGI
jgi:hypothetical protein